jgi:hypothetical protein
MHERFRDVPSALANAVAIAQRCNLTLELGQPRLPNFPTPEGVSLDDYLVQLSEQGLEKRMLQLFPDAAKRQEAYPLYAERLALECKTIIKMGFPGYFLIVQDFINWGKNNGVPVGPGRGWITWLYLMALGFTGGAAGTARQGVSDRRCDVAGAETGGGRLYWCNSTCFTGTNVQILTQEAVLQMQEEEKGRAVVEEERRQRQEDEEVRRRQEEERQREAQEEEARQRQRQQEEEARRRQEEERDRKAEEERLEEEEAAARVQRERLKEEEAAAARRKQEAEAEAERQREEAREEEEIAGKLALLVHQYLLY